MYDLQILIVRVITMLATMIGQQTGTAVTTSPTTSTSATPATGATLVSQQTQQLQAQQQRPTDAVNKMSFAINELLGLTNPSAVASLNHSQVKRVQIKKVF